MAFRHSSSATVIPSDPVQLYRQLAETNAGPESLWFHQGTVLLDWHKNHAQDRDVAIELPTGAGKTLVGGLIGEYRRRAFRERVAYLCPTRQLARQTAAKLTQYGIPNVLLIGRVRHWNMADRARYIAADAIGVSVYSHVFNSNPALDDAQLLLLDDAHAAESAVASPWSLEVNRDGEQSAYFDVLSALSGSLDPLVLARLQAETADSQYRTTVYLASPLEVAANVGLLEQTLEAAVAARKLDSEAIYAFEFIRGHLEHCLVYVSHHRVLIRPLIPPTMAHVAFDHPVRRVYMSATLGAGGELERIFGRAKVERIPIPAGWEKQGTGRRLFCFPELTDDLSRNPERTVPWVSQVIADHGRALVLTPDTRTANKFIDTCLPDGYTVLRADDVEDDLTAFTNEQKVVLVLSNRYDGIDLPDNDCRLVVLVGLPARGDLQERFLHGSLGAVEVLQERIRARIMQGAGRATRNAKDYAAVLVLGDDLVSYVTRIDVQQAMHPEIHAELDFGYKHSIGVSSTEMLDNLRIFAEHADEWREVDQRIVDDRERHERVDAPGATELQRAVRHEVRTWEAVWQGDWPQALDSSRQVLDALRGGRAPQRYAALWNYLASCMAYTLFKQGAGPSLDKAAAMFYRDARAAGRGTTWLQHLVAPADTATESIEPALDLIDERAMSGVLTHAQWLGKASVFENEIARARAALLSTPSKPYEAALVFLGKLAGALESEGDGNSDAAPDAVWIFGEMLWVAWEAKSEAKSDGELGADAVRQAGGHLRYTANRRGQSAPVDSPILIVTPQTRIHPSAHAVAESNVYAVRPEQVVDLCDRLVRAWRTARTRDLGTLSPADLAAIFFAEGALPSQWLPSLRAQALQLELEAE